jgi:hypothetical protein
MTSKLRRDFSDEPIAKIAIKQLFARLAPLVAKDDASRNALLAIERLLDGDYSESDWENIGRVLFEDLVERGITTIGERGLMPRRAQVSFLEVAEAVRRALVSQEHEAAIEARRAATRSREAFFLWALSGVSSLPSIGLFVVGLPAVAEAHRVAADHGSVSGPAQRVRRIEAVNYSSRLARETAAAALVPALASAATAAAASLH